MVFATAAGLLGGGRGSHPEIYEVLRHETANWHALMRVRHDGHAQVSTVER